MRAAAFALLLVACSQGDDVSPPLVETLPATMGMAGASQNTTSIASTPMSAASAGTAPVLVAEMPAVGGSFARAPEVATSGGVTMVSAAGSGSNGGASSDGARLGGADGSAGGTGAGLAPCAVDVDEIYADIEYLASDELRGRIPSDVGNELALDYAEAVFVGADLDAGGEDGTYRQAFPFTCGSDWCEGHRSGTTENVLGMIRGMDPDIGDEVIIVGAHIDHLGVRSDGAINYGADDNASGAAMVLQMARMFQRCGLTPKRTLLFVEWNAEEMGLIGSRYYVEHPVLPLSDTIAAYNFDMVGAGDGSGILLFGGNDAENRWLTDLMANARDEHGLPHSIELVPQKLASDHAPFVERGISVCWGFARPDPHPGYHSPNDNLAGIHKESLRAVSELFWAAIRPLAMGEEDQYSRPATL